jgi:hypothetical protein
MALTDRQALLAMKKFLEAYYDRTKGTGHLAMVISDIEFEPINITSDPAAWEDWLAAIDAAKAEESAA